jgi:hypothetical protein
MYRNPLTGDAAMLSRRAVLSLSTVAVATVSCSRRGAVQNPPAAGSGERAWGGDDQNIPGQFESHGRRYLLTDKSGVIDDDAVRYTADAGARTFDFNTKELFRNGFVGTAHTFASLKPAERQEARDVAQAAVRFIGHLKQPIPPLYREHERALRSYLANLSQ